MTLADGYRCRSTHPTDYRHIRSELPQPTGHWFLEPRDAERPGREPLEHPMRLQARKAFLAAGVCLFTAAPVLAQSPSNDTAQPSTQQTMAAPSTADFVKTVAISDMFEVQSSKL